MKEKKWNYEHTCSLCGEKFFFEKIAPGYLGAIGSNENSKYFYDIKLYKWCEDCWVKKAGRCNKKMKRLLWALRDKNEKKKEYQRNYMRFRIGFHGDFKSFKEHRKKIFQKQYLKIMGITLGPSFGPDSNVDCL